MNISIETKSDDKLSEATQPKPVSEEPLAAPPVPHGSSGFPTRLKRGNTQPLKTNRMVIFGGGACIVALLFFILLSFPGQKPKVAKVPAVGSAPTHQTDDNPEAGKSLFPITESGKPTMKDSQDGLIGDQDVQRTATREAVHLKPFAGKFPPSGSLGSIPPFDGEGAASETAANESIDRADEAPELSSRREQRSLVFVQKVAAGLSGNIPERNDQQAGSALGLPTGTRLRARLEAAASTAVKTPVIAVVEYNYQKSGEIIVPAGAKALGHIEQADRSGYVSIRFDSLLLPDGSSTSLDAVATDLRLRPLKGRVEGKNTGKNVLIRSLSGIGEVGAVFTGRGGGLDGPLSEGSLVRERLGTNIGESADQEIARLNVTERIVVSVDANTPIYVVLDRGSRQPGTGPNSSPVSQTQSLDSLRQILQLQRELNQSGEAVSH